MEARHWLKIPFLLLVLSQVSGQSTYWLFQTDLAKIDSAVLTQFSPKICSEWLQACTYTLSEDQVNQLNQWKIPLQKAASFQPLAVGNPDPAFALEQIDYGEIISRNLTGKGVKIGIIDGGFLNANTSPALAHFFKSDAIKYYQDFVTPEQAPYTGIHRLDDEHGTEVWQMIGGFDPTKNVQFGLATGATYYLARTDHGAYERRIEEDYLIQAMEKMEKMGVQLVNISLGYNIGFSEAAENYVPAQMDGRTAMLTRAVEKATLEKGMLIVVAAGNDGADKWEIVSTPSDAEHALVVGATKFDIWDKMDYSSIGADFVDYVKPDVSVYSTIGTSFSAPVITGLAACLMEYDSTLTNFELIDLIRKAGHLYPYPNNYLGYGVPSCKRIFSQMENKASDLQKVKAIQTTDSKIKLSGTFKEQLVIAYHKRDGKFVVFRNNWRPVKDVIRIQRPEGIDQTTILTGKTVTEIIWQ